VVTDARHILVIDDEEAICFAFRRYFERRGFSVTVAGTGAEGEQRFAEARPDIVFLDVRLPDANGLDVLERLRLIDSRACVVVITAYGTLETVTRAIRGKAFDYLVKPLDLDRAGQIVAEALASRAASETRQAASRAAADSRQGAGLAGTGLDPPGLGRDARQPVRRGRPAGPAPQHPAQQASPTRHGRRERGITSDNAPIQRFLSIPVPP
jgi:DNA-binding NtrC family response regulator